MKAVRRGRVTCLEIEAKSVINRYAPRNLVNEIQDRVSRARSGITFEARSVIEPEPATELSLFAPR